MNAPAPDLSAASSPAEPWRGIPRWLPWLGLVVLVAAAYHGVWHLGFIWDDDYHLTQNPCIVGPKGFWDIWTSSEARICPLVLSSFWLQHALWGLNPLPYHLVNVATHAAGALVLWRVLLAMRVRGAWFGAALWAVHPVQVESVAWITEQKNTQSGLFYLLAILFFVKWLNAELGSGRRHYALTLVFAALAMASKSSTVVLPLVLALCAWWVEGRWQWRTALRLAPVLGLSLLASVLALWTQNLEGANEPEWMRTFAERLATAGVVVWFYLAKVVWPHPLIFIYPRWEMDTGLPATWLPALAALGVAAVLWRHRYGPFRATAMALAYFVVALLPVLGILDHYFLRYSFVGDHFQYLAGMGPLALIAAGLVKWSDAPGRTTGPWIKPVLSSALLLACAAMTWQRVAVYQSPVTLWTDTVARNPKCWMAHNNLGSEALATGDVERAIEFTRRSLRLLPSNSKAHNNLGTALLQSGQLDDAIVEFREAARLSPTNVDAHNNLGAALLKIGKAEEAIASCKQVVALRPASPDALTTMGVAALLLGQADEAVAAFTQAIAIDPGYAEAHSNLGVVMFQTGRLDEAIAHGEKAVALRPNDAAARNSLGSALRQAGRVEDAIAQFRKSIELRPDNGSAHNNLANALRQDGQIAEAARHYEKAAELLPDAIAVLNNLAWVLATASDERVRNGPRSLEFAQRATALAGGESPSLLRTLAAAFAANAQFHDAEETAQRALTLNGEQGDRALADSLQRDLGLYRSSTPLREPAASGAR